MVRSDDPQSPVVFQHAAGGFEPCNRKVVIGAEIGEMIPFVINAVNQRIVGTQQLSAQLEIVRRVGENHVHRFFGQGIHQFDTVARKDDIRFQSSHKSLIVTFGK